MRKSDYKMKGAIMKRNRRIIAMLLLLFLSGTVMKISEMKFHSAERKQSFAHLKEYTEQIGNEIKKRYIANKAYLEKAADTLEKAELDDDKMLGKFMEFISGGMIEEAQLLFPGDQLLTKAGERLDISDRISFQEEEKKGVCLSGRMEDPLNTDRKILRIQIPIVQDGETKALLWGIMDLADFPEMFTIRGYGDEMELYVVEGTTGNFLMDTWHDELTNMDALGDRKAEKGYSKEQIIVDFSEGREGTTVFFSKKAGEYFYSYYCPIGVEDWMVMITVAESVAFAHAEKMHKLQMWTMALMMAVFAVYGIWILSDVRREKVADEKRLRRVQFLLEVEKQLFSAFIEPEHFIDGLKVIADYAASEEAFFLVDSREENGGCRVLSSKADERMPDDEMRELFTGLLSMLREKESLLVYDMGLLIKEFPDETKILSRYGIHNMMLVPVKRLNGETAGVLGVYNMAYHWEDAKLLEQLSITFSMTLGYYENYQNLLRLGNEDSLTGLGNRNCYHTDLEEIEKAPDCSVACVYMDANGLHEINNWLGHQAGDKMLRNVADVLRKCFREEDKYRIGGDEFVVLCKHSSKEEVCSAADRARLMIREIGYEISIGIGWGESGATIGRIVSDAESAMQKDKELYYKKNGRERQRRILNRELEQMISEKRDIDVFLDVLAPRFKGVYFVDLMKDHVRHIFIPDYFERMLMESEDKFSKAIMLYARETVEEKY